ncbi:MAG TPA: dienelactone hydrolase family protein [Thermoleophilaceae bacterium]|nr:dienelactone hydrolase family protein [Thermoleophilaceae bacterium]
MRRALTSVLTIAALVGVVPAEARPQTHRADGDLSEWRGVPTNVAGKSILSRGEHVSSDWLYDDHGANLNGGLNGSSYGGSSSVAAGDLRYPETKLNAADVRELRVAVDRRGLHVLLALETLKASDDAILTLAIDGDRRATDVLPDGSGVRAAGAERFLTTWGDSARWHTPGRTRAVRSAANLRANAIEVTVPLRALGSLRRHPRVWVVAGLNEGSGRFAQQGEAPAVFDIGTGQTEETLKIGSTWGENTQSKLLAERDVTPFAETLDLRRMALRRSDRPKPLGPGFYQRIFRSRLRLGEGVSTHRSSAENNQNPRMLSRYQPYSFYVPQGYDPRRRAPLTLLGHSNGGNHGQYASFSPKIYRQLGDERGSLVFTPLARGHDTWYLDSAFVDVLEAWQDVRRRNRVDDERVAITGYSMGGYMTYRLGLLMPDRFSRASVYVGPPAFRYWPYPAPVVSTERWRVAGNHNLNVENALNLPFEIVHGNNDELVPVAGVQEQANTFARHGNAYRFFRHSEDAHLSFLLNDEWGRTRDWLGRFKRERNPREVAYRRYPAMDLPQHGLVFDGAYWVDGIEVRGDAETDSGLVRATTLARGGRRLVAQPQPPQPVAGPTTPGILLEQRRVPGERIERQNGFEAKLVGVSGVTFDGARMGLDPDRRLHARVEADGPATVRLTGGFGPLEAFVDGAPVALTRAAGLVAVEVPAGSHLLELRPR